MILSIDVGTTNLAMCLFNPDNKEILEWDVDGIPTQNPEGLLVTLRNHLDARPWVLTAPVVLIERQPKKSDKMIGVMLFLEAYFIIKCPESTTLLWDARHKVPDVVGAGKAMYRLRKKTAITRCEDFLMNGPEVNRKWCDKWKTSKKKDDLADTVLQAMSYNLVRRVVEPKKRAFPDTIRARAPTENQKNTKYSINNLAWFVKNSPLEDLKKDRRFMKDCKRYFSSPEELRDKVLKP
tara:strand:- start:608 stop:1318 length:711 start_codon:yes stop_codon:yes gene_type:complete